MAINRIQVHGAQNERLEDGYASKNRDGIQRNHDAQRRGDAYNVGLLDGCRSETTSSIISVLRGRRKKTHKLATYLHLLSLPYFDRNYEGS